jgi:hypothetical protein
VRQLQKHPGPQLVIVGYGSHHDVDHEWVYNHADIDGSKIVWARDMGKEQNRELLRYFNARQVWFVHGDESGPELEPYR